MKSSPKLKVINAIEQGLGFDVLDIRRVSAQNEQKFYVLTEPGLMLCEIVGRKVHYHFAVISGEGTVKIPKQGDLKDPERIKLVVENKIYSAKDLIDAPPTWMDKDDEEIMKRWRYAVYVVTNGKRTKSNYAACVTVYNLKKIKDDTEH